MRSWIFATGPSFGCSCFFGRGPDFFLWVLFLRAASCTVHCPRSAAEHTAFWSSTSHHHSSTPSILIINTTQLLNSELSLTSTAGPGDTRSCPGLAIWIIWGSGLCLALILQPLRSSKGHSVKPHWSGSLYWELSEWAEGENAEVKENAHLVAAILSIIVCGWQNRSDN